MTSSKFHLLVTTQKVLWWFILKVDKLSVVFYRNSRSILKNGKTVFGYRRFLPPFSGNEKKKKKKIIY